VSAAEKVTVNLGQQPWLVLHHAICAAVEVLDGWVLNRRHCSYMDLITRGNREIYGILTCGGALDPHGTTCGQVPPWQ
jgi:hypothetical protein